MMMNKRGIICGIFGMLAVLGLATSSFGNRNKKGQRVEYEFPAAMAPNVREAFTKECDKGQALYNIACAHCHNTTLKGKTIIPDWTPAQLVGYELRVLNPKHEAGIPEEQVTAEELGNIMTFLTYKKKNK